MTPRHKPPLPLTNPGGSVASGKVSSRRGGFVSQTTYRPRVFVSRPTYFIGGPHSAFLAPPWVAEKVLWTTQERFALFFSSLRRPVAMADVECGMYFVAEQAEELPDGSDDDLEELPDDGTDPDDEAQVVADEVKEVDLAGAISALEDIDGANVAPAVDGAAAAPVALEGAPDVAPGPRPAPAPAPVVAPAPVGAPPPLPKGNRRQFTILYKLKILQRIEKGESKRSICAKEKLDKSNLQEWVKKKASLLQIARESIIHGRRLHGRCRVKGAGFATKYPALDTKLDSWWQEKKRENKERVTKLRLLNQASKFAEELKLPSTFQVNDWVDRWMRRRRVSLQAEKRISSKGEKDVLEEVQKFHVYCHSVMRNPVLKIKNENVYNTDEVPNSLTGQLHRNITSLGDVGTANEVRRSPFTVNDFKRFKTDVITLRYQEVGDSRVLLERQPVKPHVIYKMRCDFDPSPAEKAQYHPGVAVSFQPAGVVDTQWMLKNFIATWKKEATPDPRFLVYDSASAHLTAPVKEALKETSTTLAVIPGGLTSILQTLDTDFIFVYRHEYQKIAFEWADNNLDSRLTSSMRRILGTHFTAKAYEAALKKVNVAQSFTNRGYLWPTEDGSHIRLRELPAYKYDSSAALLRLKAPMPNPEADHGRAPIQGWIPHFYLNGIKLKRLHCQFFHLGIYVCTKFESFWMVDLCCYNNNPAPKNRKWRKPLSLLFGNVPDLRTLRPLLIATAYSGNE